MTPSALLPRVPRAFLAEIAQLTWYFAAADSMVYRSLLQMSNPATPHPYVIPLDRRHAGRDTLA